MKYLWTEDTGAGLHFWKLINQIFFDNELAIESKENNQGILDALSDLEIKADDKYYIAFDYVVDNQDIRNKYRILKLIADEAEGKVIILDMICFEYMKKSDFSVLAQEIFDILLYQSRMVLGSALGICRYHHAVSHRFPDCLYPEFSL